MIIVEGPDGSGKSSLVDALGKEFHLSTITKAVRSSTERAIDPTAYVSEVLQPEMTVKPWLLDRFWLISGSIYGPVLGTGAKFSHTNQEMENPVWLVKSWEMYHAAVDRGEIFVIWCLPALGTVVRNLRDDYETPESIKDHISLIWRLYYAMAHRERARDPEHNLLHDYMDEVSWEVLARWIPHALGDAEALSTSAQHARGASDD